MAHMPLDLHPLYQSLIDRPLYGGVDKQFLIVEGSVIGSVFLGAGFHLSTLGIALLWGLLLHPLMVWVYGIDPLLPALYIRSLRYRDYYMAQGRRFSRSPRANPSIPHAR